MKRKYYFNKAVTVLALIASDSLAVFLCIFLAYLVRTKLLPLVSPELFRLHVIFQAYLAKFFMFFIWIVVFMYEKLYTKRLTFWEEVRVLVKSTSISFALVMVAVFVTKKYYPFSRAILLFAWILSFAALPGFRYAAKLLLLRLGLWRKKVIIIGSREGTAKVIETIVHNPTMGYVVVGCLTDDRAKIGTSVAGVPVLGHFDEIEVWKSRTGFEDIIVTFPNIPRDRLIGLLKRWENISDTIRYIPQTGDLITTGIEIENIGKILALAVRKNLHKPWNVAVKSVFEFSLALVLFLLLLPFLAAIAAAVKLDSRGPVFFVQERFGKRGRVIRVIKFRSMYTDAEARLTDYLTAHPEAREEWETFKKIKNGDPRTTRVGRFLRRFSLDELPQLLNVLRGEMSLVGPRPYIREELEEVKQVKSLLFQVKPGITGLWQTSGRSLVPFSERLDLDEYYIRNWSLWMDVVILLKTLRTTASGKGAF